MRCSCLNCLPRLGPSAVSQKEIDKTVNRILEVLSKNSMHYRNGREAKNGDKIIKLDNEGRIVSFGILHSATPGNDYCNGNIASIQAPNDYACMVDCLHIEDVASILAKEGLATRPIGK